MYGIVFYMYIYLLKFNYKLCLKILSVFYLNICFLFILLYRVKENCCWNIKIKFKYFFKRFC